MFLGTSQNGDTMNTSINTKWINWKTSCVHTVYIYRQTAGKLGNYSYTKQLCNTKCGRILNQICIKQKHWTNQNRRTASKF